MKECLLCKLILILAAHKIAHNVHMQSSKDYDIMHCIWMVVVM